MLANCTKSLHMQITPADHLVAAAGNALQGWKAAVASGLAALGQLQQGLGELDAPKPSEETMAVYKRLLQLAPSQQLEKYIQQQQKRSATPSEAAGNIHTALTQLRAAVAAAQEQLEQLSCTCTQYEAAMLPQQVSDMCAVVPAAPTPGAFDGLQAEQAAAEPSGMPDPGTAMNTESTDLFEGPEQATALQQQQQQLQTEELAVLMLVVVEGLQQDLQWMEAAVSSMSLDVTSEQLSTLSTLWELQPFTNEAAVASLAAAAAAAAAAADDESST